MSRLEAWVYRISIGFLLIGLALETQSPERKPMFALSSATRTMFMIMFVVVANMDAIYELTGRGLDYLYEASKGENEKPENDLE